jgi:hypothetical protein
MHNLHRNDTTTIMMEEKMMKRLTRKSNIYMALLGCLLLPRLSVSATLEDVDQRLKKLESDVELTREEADDTASRFKNSLSVSGYADTELVATNDPNGKKSGFRIHHFSVFMKKQVSDNLRFFSETEWEDGPFHDAGTGAGAIFVEALNFNYQWRPDTDIRLGRFFTPAGIWSVDHYPPFVATQELPQHIRKIFPAVVDGAALSGNHPVGKAFVNYDLYVGNSETPTFDGSQNANATTATGLRVNASLPIAQQFDLGFTLYHDKLAIDPLDTSATANGPKKNVQGIHAKIKQGAIGFQAEYAKGNYGATTFTPTTYNSKGYYAQFTYDINKWTLGYRYDFYNPQSTVAQNGTQINSAILNYHVSNNVVLKWEHHLANLQDAAKKDYYRSIASIAVNLD